MNVPSRIGTAPFSPAHSTKARSPRRSRTGHSSSPTQHRPDRRRPAATARTRPVHQHAAGRDTSRSPIVRPEHRERDDLAEAGQRRSGTARSPACTARARRRAGSRRRTRRGSPNRARRVATPVQERGRRPARAAGTAPSLGSGTRRMNRSAAPRRRRRRRRRRPPSAGRTPPRPCADARASRRRSRRAGDHQRDADRVVGAGLALEDGAGAAGDLAAAQHREDHRRVGRGQRGAEQQRRRASRSRTACARARRAPPAVTNVPATPSQTIGAGRRHGTGASPMCMPPSNRITTSATVTICSTAGMGSRPRPGHRSEASAAQTRKIAGAGTRSRSLTRLDRTADRADERDQEDRQSERLGVRHGAAPSLSGSSRAYMDTPLRHVCPARRARLSDMPLTCPSDMPLPPGGFHPTLIVQPCSRVGE